MMEQRQSRKIVAAVVALGQSLGLTTVAEGVETKEQADMLIWLGCEAAQGWLYGRPVAGTRLLEKACQQNERTSAGAGANQRDALAASLEVVPWQGLAQLRALYRSTSVGLCYIDRNLRFTSLNRRYAELNGLPVSAHLGRPVKEVIPHIFNLVEPLLLRALHGESIEDEEVTRPAHGPGSEDVVMLHSYQPVSDEAGELIGISLSVVDITECKRIETLLQESEEHYRLMVDLNPQAPWILDAQGHVLDVSSQWVEMTGLNKTRSRKLGWLDALHPDDVKEVMAALRKSLDGSTRMDFRYRVWDVRRNEWHWLRAIGVPRFDATGSVHYWYGYFENLDGLSSPTDAQNTPGQK